MEPRNILLKIQYDGTQFHGWQRQLTQRTVQGVLEHAIQKLTGEMVTLHGSGRTDAGVHALCQVANFWTTSPIPISGIKKGLNSLLPQDVAIIDAKKAEPWFHARKSAKKKLYTYVICQSHSRLPILRNRAWVVRPGLDIQAMQEALLMLKGTHDFKGFQKSGSSVKTTTRTICHATLREQESGVRFVHIHIAADGFLRYMVRNIVGMLVAIGRGKLPTTAAIEVLKSGERQFQWQTAPPQGLYLVKVFYDRPLEEEEVPE